MPFISFDSSYAGGYLINRITLSSLHFVYLLLNFRKIDEMEIIPLEEENFFVKFFVIFTDRSVKF